MANEKNFKIKNGLQLSGQTNNLTMSANHYLKHTNTNGYIQFGPANTAYAHIQSDRPQFYFNKKLIVDEGIISSYNEDLILKRASSTTNQLTIGTSAATFAGNLVVSGDLTINGTTITNSATNTTIEDALIELGSGNTGTNSNDLGLILERGSTGNNVFIGWDESEDRVAFGTTTATGASTGSISYSRASILANALDLTNHIDMADSAKIRLGAGDDLQLYHNGTDSAIDNLTGDLYITNTANDKDIIFRSDDGSGGFHTYFLLDGSNNKTQFNRHLKIIDSMQLQLGTAPDLLIYHDGSNSYITEQGTGDLIISADNDLTFKDGSGNLMANMNASNSVELYFGNSKKFETTSAGAQVSGSLLINEGSAFTDFNIKSDRTSGNIGGMNFVNASDVVKGQVYGDVGGQVFIASGGSTLAILIDASQNIGLGHSTPEEKLEVAGNIRMQSTISTTTARPAATVATLSKGEIRAKNSDGSDGGLLRLSAGAGTTLSTLSYIDLQGYSNQETNNGKHIIFGTGGADRMEITESGNVGIGTATPSEKLSIAPDTDVSAEIGRAHIGSVGHSDYAGFSHVDKNTTGNFALMQHGSGETYLNASSGTAINFRLNNSATMLLNATGLGIGTTSPGAKLEINGATKLGNATYTAGVDSFDSALVLPQTRNINSLTSDGNYLRSIFYHHSNGNFIFGQQGTSLIADMVFYPGSTGNFRVFASGAEDFRVNSSGNVGIGTASPGVKLHVSSGTTNRVAKFVSTDATAYIQIADNSTTATTHGYGANGNDLSLYANDAERIRIKSDGDVGIGTTSPSQKLHVAGNIYAASGFVNSSGYQLNGTYIVDSSRNLVNIVNLTTTGGATIGDSSADALTFFGILKQGGSGGTTVIDSSRNLVNIGTISIGQASNTKGAKLEALGTDAKLQVHFSGASRGGIGAFSSQRVGMYTTSSNDDLIFGTTTTGASADFVTRMHINNGTGNVGIGTTNPTNHLNTSTNHLPVDNNARFLTINGGANGAFVMLESSTTTDADQIGGLVFTRTGGQADAHKNIASIDCEYDSASLGGGILRFFTKPNGSGTPTPRMKIDQTGNLYMGSTIVLNQSRNLTNIGTYTGSGEIIIGNTSGNFSQLSSVGSIELCRTDANGFIDFKSSSSEDFDARIQQSSNGLVFYTGGNGSTAIGLTLDSARNAQFASMVDIPSKLRHSGDTDTCLNFTTDTIALETGGSAALTLNSSQNATFAGTISSGAITATNGFKADGIWTSNEQPSGDDAIFSGYGAIGNRGAFYVTNGGGTVQIGNGATHNANPTATFSTSVVNLGASRALQLNGTTVIDSSRNLTNIGTISSGAITSSGQLQITVPDGTGNAGGLYFRESGQQIHRIYPDNQYQYNSIGSSDPNWIWLQEGGSQNARLYDTGFDLKQGAYQINGTTVIDSSRNLTNIGSISATEFTGHIEAGGHLDFNIGTNHGTTGDASTWWISQHSTGQSDVPGTYYDIINLSMSTTHGIQLASRYGSVDDQFWIRSRSDNGSAPAGTGLQAWKRLFHEDHHPNADTLTTARTIGGVSFNGSANIDLPGVNTAGNQNTSGTAAGLSGTPNITVGTISSGNITGRLIKNSQADSTPLSTQFANTICGENSNRVIYFDSGGQSLVSTWYGNGNNAFTAIDSTDGVMDFWINDSSSNWYNIADCSSSGFNVSHGALRIGGTTVISSSRALVNIDSILITGQANGGTVLGLENNSWVSLKDSGGTLQRVLGSSSDTLYVGDVDADFTTMYLRGPATMYVQTNNTTALTIDSNQNVTVAAGLYVPDKIQHVGDTDTYMQFSAANVWRVVANNSQIIKCTSTTFEVDKGATFAGTVDIPSKLRHLGDTDTCLNFTTDTITLETAGAARVAIDSSGLAIGNSSILTRIRSLSNSGFTDTVIENFSSGAYRERLRINSSGSFLAGITSQVGIGGTPADENSFELGRGYLNLSRDDTANAKQITFAKNGAVHSSIETKSSTFTINSSVNTLAFTGTTLALGGFATAKFTSSGGYEFGDLENDDRQVKIIGFGDTSRITLDDGSVAITGALSKSSGSFKIDHPLKPDTHHLVHSFVEGPQADNLYRGKIQLVNGKAEVDLEDKFNMTPGTFEALNRDIQIFTTNESNWDNVRGSVVGSKLIIESQNINSTAEVSWLVIGERQDKEIYESKLTDNDGKIIVEPQK